MRIIAVDDEPYALISIKQALIKVTPESVIETFSVAADSLKYADNYTVDVAFLDIEMNELDGLSLAKRLKEINHNTNIIFVTGYSGYMKNAFDMHASGYILKPIREEQVASELQNLRRQPGQAKKGVQIKCFGDFQVYINGELLLFSRSKAKELLAYLVHKQGAPVSNHEIASLLWPEETYNFSLQSNTRNVISRLLKILKEVGIADIVLRTRNNTALNINKVSCDYYNYLDGDAQAVNSYKGEYMKEYDWAEFSIPASDEK